MQNGCNTPSCACKDRWIDDIFSVYRLLGSKDDRLQAIVLAQYRVPPASREGSSLRPRQTYSVPPRTLSLWTCSSEFALSHAFSSVLLCALVGELLFRVIIHTVECPSAAAGPHRLATSPWQMKRQRTPPCATLQEERAGPSRCFTPGMHPGDTPSEITDIMTMGPAMKVNAQCRLCAT